MPCALLQWWFFPYSVCSVTGRNTSCAKPVQLLAVPETDVMGFGEGS